MLTLLSILAVVAVGAISVDWALKLDTTEDQAGPFVNANAKAIKQSGLSTNSTSTGTTTPAVTKDAYFQQALTAGAATIDLTNMTLANGSVVNFSTLKVQLYKFRNPGTNLNAITVTFGAANPYLLHGAAWKFILQPGDEIMTRLPNTAPTVDATHKNIDISGTGTQALDVGLVAG
jgi:hypothetical protein